MIGLPEASKGCNEEEHRNTNVVKRVTLSNPMHTRHTHTHTEAEYVVSAEAILRTYTVHSSGRIHCLSKGDWVATRYIAPM